MARVRFVLVVILLGAIVIFAGALRPAHAVSCGDILGPGGNFELQADLDCLAGPGFSRSVTVMNGAILDLNGHIVTCNFFPCVVLSGAGAQLLNGTVLGGLHEGLVLEGTGGHTVKNVTSSRGLDGNVVVASDNNRLINVMARGTFLLGYAFLIGGDNNELIDSIAHCTNVSFGCIRVEGNGNRVVDNFVTSDSPGGGGTSGPGLQISGNNNVVRRNRAIANSGGPFGFFSGINVTGTGNDLRHNTALDNNPVDLRDANGNCLHNTWKFNTFVTRNPPCIQ